MKTAFITGASGFLGLNLIKEFLELNWKIIAFHLPSDDLKNLSGMNIDLVQGDILDYQSLFNAIPEEEDVTVFHIAGDKSMGNRNADRQYKINVLGTKHVAEAALARNVKKLVYTSSISAYGYHSVRVNESTPSNAPTCRMNYNKTKYLAEQEIHKAVNRGLDAVILNPCNIMGPCDSKGWSSLITSVVEEKVPGVTTGVGTFAHVKDVAKAHIKAAESGRSGENYLLGGVEIMFKDIFQEINGMLQKNVKLRTIPKPIFRLAMYFIRFNAFLKKEEPILTYPRYKRLTGHIVCDDTKARKELSYTTSTMKEMLQDSYIWLLKEGIIPGTVK